METPKPTIVQSQKIVEVIFLQGQDIPTLANEGISSELISAPLGSADEDADGLAADLIEDWSEHGLHDCLHTTSPPRRG